MRVVQAILDELGTSGKSLLTVYNKIDLVPDPEVVIQGLRLENQKALFISAKTGEGLSALRSALIFHFMP